MLLGVGLAVGVLLLIALGVLLGFLPVLGCVHTAPAATAVRLLPARASVLVNISVVAGVQIAAGRLANSRVAVS